MEAPELDAMGSHSSSSSGECPCPYPASVMTKRKRTKRPRALSSPPPPFAAASSTSSVDISAATITEEEEDMAHCLILLAQGRALRSSPPPPTEKFTSRKFTEATTTAGGKAGFYVYECKTCNKCFPSFQALGGHRASHKKPKLSSLPITTTDDNKIQVNEELLNIVTDTIVPATANSPRGNNNNNNNNNNSNNKMRVHECSICGAEFSSGQALGGHMRRHRPIVATKPESSQEVKKERNVLSLDLNLPAPSDENSPQFSFADKQRPMVFSATSALVDCHY